MDEATRLLAALQGHEDQYGALPGLGTAGSHQSLVLQLIDSQRRNRYVDHLRSVELSDRPLDPSSGLFDPVRAAIILARRDELDEAFWMIFLYTHFGKNRRSGFGYARAVYGALDQGESWSWRRTTADVSAFRVWLQENKDAIRASNMPGGFGNHRKYESLDGWSDKGTGAVFESYVDWVGPVGHVDKLADIANKHGGALTFEGLSGSLREVKRFGRTACFDYVMMANKVGLIDCPPSHAHLKDATGPAAGARLLFKGNADLKAELADLELALERLQGSLSVGYDVLEDAICNWQKSPSAFKSFRG